MAIYQVTGACCTVRLNVPGNGVMQQMLYQDAVLPAGVSAKEIEHLLSVNLIKRLDEDPPAPAAPDAADAEVELNEPANDEDDAGREAARAQLPAGGAQPTANASKAVWVEYAVSRGYAYAEAAGSTKAELVALLNA